MWVYSDRSLVLTDTMEMESPAACDAATMAAANLDPDGHPVKIAESVGEKEEAEVDEIVYHDEL